ncbi:MAG: copper resistance protein CopC/CopD [Acidobacteria bacterium]|nr:copper resistance protein CopC/CopD [Acidobacteriota bacterium]
MTLSELRNGATRVSPLRVLLAAFLLLAPQAAFAHAKLLRSEPNAKSSLPRPPQAVELWFSEELEAGFNTIEVKDERGSRFNRGEVTLGEGGRKARVELHDLPAGNYTVEWKALSSDEHTLRGKFTFTVAASAPATTATGATQPPQDMHAGMREQATPAPAGGRDATAIEGVGGEEGSALNATDSLVRWLGYLAMMTLLGGFASRLFVLGPALREARADGPETAGQASGAASGRSVLLFRVSIAALILSLLTALVLQSSAVHSVGLGEALSPSRLGGVIVVTGYGKSWLVQAAASAVLLIIIALFGRAVSRDPEGEHKGLWWAGLAASALLVAGPSLTGHAAVAAKHFRLAAVSDWLHLVAGGVWVGGLFHLALTLPRALAGFDGEQRARALGRVISLFTRMVLPSVAVLTLAGIYNAYAHLGGVRALWVTPYGLTLAAKLALVLVMLVLGALNGFRFGPRTRRFNGDEAGRAGVERGFGRSVKVEAALGVLVLLISAFLVFISPGRNHESMSAGGKGQPPVAVTRAN